MNAWDEPADRVRGFVNQQGIRYPVLLAGKSVAIKYGVRGVPMSFFIDPEGKIVAEHLGLADPSWMEAKIREILPRS